jgi:hypothetical protein
MLSRTEKISGFPLKVSRCERELYEEFCNIAEAELLREMRDYFIEAKQRSRKQWVDCVDRRKRFGRNHHVLRKRPVAQQHGATFSSWEEDVAKLCCLFLLNGNRISQQRFMPEDLVQVVET